MKTLVVLCLCIHTIFVFAQPTQKEVSSWTKTAQRVTIIRDQWGIPHIYGKSNADAVFGLMYAQCEDDFSRIEMNYIEKLGRRALVEGEKFIYDDLYIRLIITEADAKSDYEKSPAWFKKLLNAFADGINYYLYKHPEIEPKLLFRFEPWYPLLWTDGSIGAISTGFVDADHVKNFYSATPKVGEVEFKQKQVEQLDGSNGFAIAGSRSESGNAMLYINPHVTLYFRPEVHVVSDEGLNSYGAVTWGQFFVYQGFNQYNGWMHTSSDADVADLYLEKITKRDDNYYYEYNGESKQVSQQNISISFRTEKGMEKKMFTTYATHHGPVMSQREEHWISVKSNNRSMTGLIQCWQRMTTKGLEDYKKVMDLRANTSNNTVFADYKGNIAYWHGNFMPRRDTSLNWANAVDGTVAATEWKGLHTVDETVHIYNPENGWLQNCNSTPFTAAGQNSPKQSMYPKYMAPDTENFRGVNAVRVLQNHNGKFTLDQLITVGYDRHLAAFEQLVPPLVKAYENLSPTDTSLNQFSEAITILKNWDYQCSEESIATTLAVEWGQTLLPKMTVQGAEYDYEIGQLENTKRFLATTNDRALLESFQKTLQDLSKRYGKWKLPWGEINRFQRIAGSQTHQFSDDSVSLPLGLASSTWGMLPSAATRTFSGTLKRYCWGGNSFVCAVEFGPRLKAKSLLAGGQSGDPKSPHFRDQAVMYTKGIFKDVLFYKEDVVKHAERTYHPGY